MPEEAKSGQRQGNEEHPYEDENATMSEGVTPHSIPQSLCVP